MRAGGTWDAGLKCTSREKYWELEAALQTQQSQHYGLAVEHKNSEIPQGGF